MERDLSREAAERLLSGDPVPPPGTDALAAILAAASAPARPHELVGEDAALAAFRAHPPAVAGRPLRRAFALKVAAFVAATVAVGGVAYASSTGLLPNPFGPSNVQPSPSPTGDPFQRRNDPSGSVAPTAATEAMQGLCHAYEAHPSAERGKALQAPAFTALVTAAGGADRVPEYCANVAKEHKDSKESKEPKAPTTTPPDRRPNGTPAPMPTTPRPGSTKATR